MRWLKALWLDLWRGPYTATPGPEPLRTITANSAVVYVAPRKPRTFTFERRQ